MRTIRISIISSRRAAIGEGSSFAILLDKCLIIQFFIRCGCHNRSTSISEANDLIINLFTLVELTLEELRMLFTEQVRTIETTIKILQNSTTSTRHITPLIDRSAITLHNLIPQRTLITLKYR